MRKHSRAPPTFGRARALGISKGEVYAIVHDRLGKRVSSVKQLGEQSFKKLYKIMMALDGRPRDVLSRRGRCENVLELRRRRVYGPG